MPPHHPPPKICHFDRRDGTFCRPGAEQSLFDFGFQAKSVAPYFAFTSRVMVSVFAELGPTIMSKSPGSTT